VPVLDALEPVPDYLGKLVVRGSNQLGVIGPDMLRRSPLRP
jgi:hypothetical protein